MSRPLLLLLPCALALATAACGGGGDDDDGRSSARVAVSDDAAAEALPAPMQAPGGAVTGMPDAPGPGNVPLADGDAPQPSADAQATLYVDGVAVPLLAEDGTTALPPLRDATSGQGVAIAAGTLPPLEDNPETGLGPEGYIEVSRAPRDGHAADAVADAASAAADPGATTADAGRQAAAAVRAYYDAIGAGDYRRAYAAWSDGGRSSGRSPEQFASTFEGTRIVRVSIGAPGRVEGAAGSRYVEVPVTVTSHTADGRELRQAGSFAMRSSQVEGGAPGWRIVSADLRELQP